MEELIASNHSSRTIPPASSEVGRDEDEEEGGDHVELVGIIVPGLLLALSVFSLPSTAASSGEAG